MVDRTEIAKACLGWWGAWISADGGEARATRARMRRAGSPAEALGVPAIHDLNSRLAAAGGDLRRRADKLFEIAAVLAAVETHTGDTRLAVHFGGRETPALSGIRFEAILRARDPDARRRALTRALPTVDGRASVSALGADLFFWGDRVRARWCFDYYGAPGAAPSAPETELQEGTSI